MRNDRRILPSFFRTDPARVESVRAKEPNNQMAAFCCQDRGRRDASNDCRMNVKEVRCISMKEVDAGKVACILTRPLCLAITETLLKAGDRRGYSNSTCWIAWPKSISSFPPCHWPLAVLKVSLAFCAIVGGGNLPARSVRVCCCSQWSEERPRRMPGSANGIRSERVTRR